jgi:hypothetical protein
VSPDEPLHPVDLWQPPVDAGDPVGCVATSFTFDPRFFEGECLPAFLGVDPPGDDAATELEALLLMEDALAQAPVTVLVDRSCRQLDRSSLRWDLLPVEVAGGLLHMKVAVLVWSSVARIIVGSANLTPAGYHRKLELVSSTDIGAGITPGWTHEVAADVINEVRSVLEDLVPPGHPARTRAGATLDAAASLLNAHPLPEPAGRARIAAVPSAGGRPALDGFSRVWPEGRAAPTAATVLSPFWDDVEAPAPNQAVNAVADRLARRGQITLAVVRDPIDPSIVRAPASLLDLDAMGRALEVRYFEPADAEPDGAVRPVHAKAVVFEGAEWVAAMVGSSNVTASGLGLRNRAHRELNLWIGAPRSSPTGDAIRRLVTCGPVVTSSVTMEPEPDEDQAEPDLPGLPRFFESALVSRDGENGWILELTFGANPPDSWSVTCECDTVAQSTDPPASPTRVPVGEPPRAVTARWSVGERHLDALWPVTAVDPCAVPVTGAADVGVLGLLSVLSGRSALRSTTGLPAGSESAAPEVGGPPGEVDPLKVHLDPSRLIPRVRSHARALARIEADLTGPLFDAATLERRLNRPLGLLTIANGLADEAPDLRSGLLPGEAAFLIAELGWLLRNMTWQRQPGAKPAAVKAVRREALRQLAAMGARLQPADPSLADYLRRATAVTK